MDASQGTIRLAGGIRDVSYCKVSKSCLLRSYSVSANITFFFYIVSESSLIGLAGMWIYFRCVVPVGVATKSWIVLAFFFYFISCYSLRYFFSSCVLK